VREWQEVGGLDKFGPWAVLQESRPGSAFARRTGMAHASGDVLLLVDDDNALHPPYVARGLDLMRSRPRLGACGGVGQVSSTVQIPDWFAEAESLYVCGERGLGQSIILPTAGLMVRRSALLELDAVGFRPVLNGRVGADTMCGEDSELTAAISLLGWELWKEHHMRFDHCLEPRRLTEEYCMQLTQGIGRSNVFVAEYMRWVARQSGRRVIKFAVPWLLTLALQRVLYALQLLLTRGDTFAVRQRRAMLVGLRDGAAMGLRIGRFRKLRSEIRKLCARVQRYRVGRV
jgi:glycosyltransferase involved in cell wall biosynthesis